MHARISESTDTMPRLEMFSRLTCGYEDGASLLRQCDFFIVRLEVYPHLRSAI